MITPINFSRNPIGINAVLARGSSAVSQIVQQNVQLGRDQANNQARQERDILTEQRREINRRDRRRESDQQDFEDTRRHEEDQRQFNELFDQRESRAAEGIEQATLDRGLSARRVELAEDQAGVANTFARNRDGREERRLKISESDATLRKADKVREQKIDDVRLKQAQAALDNAKSEKDRATARAELVKQQQGNQSAILQNIDRAISSGDLETAQSIYRTHVLNPSFGFDATARRSLEDRVGFKDGENVSPSGEGDVASMSLEELENELADRTEGDQIRQRTKGSEKGSQRQAELKREIAERKANTSEGRQGRLSDFIRTGRASRNKRN